MEPPRKPRKNLSNSEIKKRMTEWEARVKAETERIQKENAGRRGRSEKFITLGPVDEPSSKPSQPARKPSPQKPDTGQKAQPKQTAKKPSTRPKLKLTGTTTQAKPPFANLPSKIKKIRSYKKPPKNVLGRIRYEFNRFSRAGQVVAIGGFIGIFVFTAKGEKIFQPIAKGVPESEIKKLEQQVEILRENRPNINMEVISREHNISGLPEQHRLITIGQFLDFESYRNSRPNSFVNRLFSEMQLMEMQHEDGRIEYEPVIKNFQITATVLPMAYELYKSSPFYSDPRFGDAYFDTFCQRLLYESHGDFNAYNTDSGDTGLNQIRVQTARDTILPAARADSNFPLRNEILRVFDAAPQEGYTNEQLRTIMKQDIRFNCALAIAHDWLILKELETPWRLGNKFKNHNPNDLLLLGYYYGGQRVKDHLVNTSKDDYVAGVRGVTPNFFQDQLR